jgi:hypothetical protein
MNNEYEQNGYLVINKFFTEQELQGVREVVLSFHESWKQKNAAFYTDKAVNVINLYFDTYFPRAIKVGEELRKRGGEERLKWMTQTYLVSLFLDCPAGLGLHCPSADAITQFKEAVAAGDITWQAFPHNAGVTRLCPFE